MPVALILKLMAFLPLLLPLGWMGLLVKPNRFPPYPKSSTLPARVPIPEDLPAPVARYLHKVGGESLPLTESAVLSGPARLRFGKITFNSRARFVQQAGRGYRHYIEATIFGWPLLKANEIVFDGTGQMTLPFGTMAGPEIDQAGNLSLWAEQVVWMPSVLVTDPRLRWEAIDDTSARLFVPFKDGEDEFLVTFDPATGLLETMEAMRYKDQKGEKIRWTVRAQEWGTFNGLLIPTCATLTWADEKGSWATFSIEDVAYHVEVSEYIHARGL